MMNLTLLPLPQLLLGAIQIGLALWFGVRLAHRLHSQRALAWSGLYVVALLVCFQALTLTACSSVPVR